MNILYVTTLFDQKASSASIRNNALVKGLLMLNHNVTVLTVQWPENNISPHLREKNNCNIIRDKIKSLEILKYSSKSKIASTKRASKIRGFIRDILFFPDICKEWVNTVDTSIANDFDILISSSDHKTSHFVAKKIKEANSSLKWIQIWGDPWEDDIYVKPFLRPYIRTKEKKLLAAADIIVYISQPTQKLIRRKYPLFSDKIKYVPRGYLDSVPLQEKNNKTYYSLVYTGSLSAGRNIDHLLEAIKRYNQTASRPIIVEYYGRFVFDSKSEDYPFLRNNGVIDYDKIPTVLSKADGVLFISNSALSTQIPGKIFDYMATHCPILCLLDNANGEIANFLRQIKKCFVVSNSQQEIELSLSKFVSMMEQVYEPDETYSPKNIAAQIIDLL